MAWIAAVVQNVAQLGIGIGQTAVAAGELRTLPGYKEYSLNQDLATATSIARKGAQQGMTPEERAVAGQAIGTQQSRTQRAMEQRGLGSLAAAITQSNATEAFNRLEAQNQQIKRDYLGTYGQLGSKVQALENANVTSFNQQLALQQQELGKAAQAGLSSIVGTLGSSIGKAAMAFDKDSTDMWRQQIEEARFKRAQGKLDLSGSDIGVKTEIAPEASEDPLGQIQTLDDGEFQLEQIDPSLGGLPDSYQMPNIGTENIFGTEGSYNPMPIQTVDMSSFDTSSLITPTTVTTP